MPKEMPWTHQKTWKRPMLALVVILHVGAMTGDGLEKSEEQRHTNKEQTNSRRRREEDPPKRTRGTAGTSVLWTFLALSCASTENTAIWTWEQHTNKQVRESAQSQDLQKQKGRQSGLRMWISPKPREQPEWTPEDRMISFGKKHFVFGHVLKVYVLRKMEGRRWTSTSGLFNNNIK